MVEFHGAVIDRSISSLAYCIGFQWTKLDQTQIDYSLIVMFRDFLVEKHVNHIFMECVGRYLYACVLKLKIYFM